MNIERTVIVSAAFGLIAALLYPGGTALDRTTLHYSLTHNFLSDLGMTVAYDGRSNRTGALSFVTSLCLLVLGAGSALLGFVRLYSREGRARWLARATMAGGMLACLAFVGVALTPENRAMTLHVQFTLFAFRAVPVVTLLLALAAHASGVASRGSVVAWAGLTAILTAYVALLSVGPSLATEAGLVIYVIAQKIVALAAVGVILYQVRHAEPASGTGPAAT